jgi:hypothetical protein
VYVQVSLDYYRRESAKIITIFKECSPDGEIGKLGCVAHYQAPPVMNSEIIARKGLDRRGLY